MSDYEAEYGPQPQQVADDVAGLKQGAGSKMSDRASDLYESVSDTSKKSADAIAAHVQQRPLTSLLIAFTAGFVVSKILTR